MDMCPIEEPVPEPGVCFITSSQRMYKHRAYATDGFSSMTLKRDAHLDNFSGHPEYSLFFLFFKEGKNKCSYSLPELWICNYKV